MCPCDAACKICATRGKITCSVSHASCKRSVGMLGKETAKQNLSSAELRDGTRDSVLALKPRWQCFTCIADALAFRWLRLVLRKSQRILAFLVLNLHAWHAAGVTFNG